MSLHVYRHRAPCAWATVLALVVLVMAGSTSVQPVDILATWGGDFWSRPRLTGSWGGLLDELGKKGVVCAWDSGETGARPAMGPSLELVLARKILITSVQACPQERSKCRRGRFNSLQCQSIARSKPVRWRMREGAPMEQAAQPQESRQHELVAHHALFS